MAKVLSSAQRTAVVSALVDGNSIRATARITGVSKDTVLKLMVELGEACARFHNDTVRGLSCEQIQADEVWSFVGAKARNVRPEKVSEQGDLWTWIALDPASKLVVSFLVGPRNQGAAHEFMQDVAERVTGRFQLSTDGLGLYPPAVEHALGARVDYAQIIKEYGQPPEREGERRYSPAVCLKGERVIISDEPDQAEISTSHVERQNLTLRMSCRRFTRLTNAHSKKVYNHFCAFAIYAVHYNFCRMHSSIRCTPAMAADLAKSPWSIAQLVALLPPTKHAGGRPRKSA